MLISDWSSYVCSSDLVEVGGDGGLAAAAVDHHLAGAGALVELHLRQIRRQLAVLQHNRQAALADLHVPALDDAGLDREVGIDRAERRPSDKNGRAPSRERRRR